LPSEQNGVRQDLNYNSDPDLNFNLIHQPNPVKTKDKTDINNLLSRPPFHNNDHYDKLSNHQLTAALLFVLSE